MSETTESKTARLSNPQTSKKLSPEAQVRGVTSARLVPLAAGRFVYFHDPLTGTTPKLATGSDTFVEALREPCAHGLAPRIRAELEAFDQAYPSHGWAATLDRLVAAEVL
jgi:hypothetical protein